MACVPSYEAPGTLMRVSPKDPGFERFRARPSRLAWRLKWSVTDAQNIFDLRRKSRSCGHVRSAFPHTKSIVELRSSVQ